MKSEPKEVTLPNRSHATASTSMPMKAEPTDDTRMVSHVVAKRRGGIFLRHLSSFWIVDCLFHPMYKMILLRPP